MVFVRTRHGVDRLARQLRQHGIKAGYLHGGRTQSQRTRALEVFTAGKVDALVATDVAARGIHVDGVVCVLHYDPPAETKDYVHRSGRTARAGAGGTVISLLDPVQVTSSQKMQRELGIDAEIEPPPPAPPPPGQRARPARGRAQARDDGQAGRQAEAAGRAQAGHEAEAAGRAHAGYEAEAADRAGRRGGRFVRPVDDAVDR